MKKNGINIHSSFDLSDVKHYSDDIPEKPCANGHTDGPHHSCAYVDAINRLIPNAKAAADLYLASFIETSGETDPEILSAQWNSAFHDEMNAEAEAAGLRKLIPGVERMVP